LRCFTYVLNENVFSKKMIYESRNVICKNDNIIWNYVWMHAKAQRLGGDNEGGKQQQPCGKVGSHA